MATKTNKKTKPENEPEIHSDVEGDSTTAGEAASRPAAMLVNRKDEAGKIVSKYTGWAAGTGAIPFPIWDVAALMAVQVKLLKELLALYEVKVTEKKARATISLLFGSLSPTVFAGVTASSILKFVPFAGHALASFTLPTLAAASSYATGKVMVSHLEKGCGLEGVDSDETKEEFNESFNEGREKADSTFAAEASA